MAWKMAFTDASGNYNPDAYWKAAQVNIGVVNGNAHIDFLAYKDNEARLEKRQPIPGGTKSYTIAGQEFADMYAAHVAPGGPNLLQMVYAYSLSHLDTPDGQGGFKSFFDGAVAV